MALAEEIRQAIIRQGTAILDPWIGSEETKKEVLAVLLAGRNLILEGPPGVGKTLLAKSIAQSLPDIQARDCSFHCEPADAGCPQCRSGRREVITVPGQERFVRVQGSPEITAEDLIGDIDPVLALKYGVLDPRAFFPGKIIKAHRKVLFVDEINRLSEKLQNALLQVLQEGELTIGNFDLHFRIDTMLIATMNSRDVAGIETLSEALKDRLERVEIPYPTAQEELRILATYGRNRVSVPPHIRAKIVRICGMTREAGEGMEFPAGPRAALAVFELAQGFAEMRKAAEVGTEDLAAAVRVACLGRISPGAESAYFDRPDHYIKDLQRIAREDDEQPG